MLCQHYFRVPLDGGDWLGAPGAANSDSENHSNGGGSLNGSGRAGTWTPPSPIIPPTSNGTPLLALASIPATSSEEPEEDLMKLWYVPTPFEVVCVLDGMDEEDENGMSERPRPLIAVDFGHAVWIEYADLDGEDGGDPEVGEDDDGAREGEYEDDNEQDGEVADVDAEGGAHGEDEGAHRPKWLRFVTFPPFCDEYTTTPPSTTLDTDSHSSQHASRIGQVRTLEVPPELNLDSVETINIDQSQGAILLSVREGQIFILCYE